ncbi:MAG TPA: cytochrome oxidase small assembly protein [Burkholderiales bacterium]|nr:cytochrome oxidase small assembly protein [Burkholderiales bacterium]HYA46133.1 cytochrome oxidase small assembly protein [Burkholderiales bacterium]
MTREQQPDNLRTALVLGSIALAFFLGIVLKYFLLK